MMADNTSFESGDYKFTINEDGQTVTLNKYLGNDAVVSIPQTVEYNGAVYTVNTIRYDAFSYCSSLTEVSVPEGVTTIGAAFIRCENLEKITLPDSLTSIADSTFTECSRLKEINLPQNLTYLGGAFFGCTSLEEITLPKGITTIESYTFYNCRNLRKMVGIISFFDVLISEGVKL